MIALNCVLSVSIVGHAAQLYNSKDASARLRLIFRICARFASAGQFPPHAARIRWISEGQMHTSSKPLTLASAKVFKIADPLSLDQRWAGRLVWMAVVKRPPSLMHPLPGSRDRYRTAQTFADQPS
ncbi:hypothetical protein PHLGIDRAFT_366455 [Phlebiopsis gigantea 11061_1 CR5-6]|uniref:Uncharacterized protein n=1 Tax=Phlebiopsis gigantea (strain 11061_1 CR5-6) TaxID=745531 RepID=A0A0C3PP67_PHLG1|nr:hypothetical protein PHLGIDRAFT_366455 [Phlebiopsis gigantea 11061_1 CR5-6]